jgi:hypothetical protein
VQSVFEPLLSNYYELMVELPTDVQNDIQNILTIYPDVAQKFGLRMKPPMAVSLQQLAEHLGAGGDQTEYVLDLAAEPQKPLDSTKDHFCLEGQGFFTTDKGNCVFLEISFSEPNFCATLIYQPVGPEIQVHICGVYTVSLTPQEPTKKLPVSELLKVFKNCPQGMTVRVSEK